jgi:hypothetical protein
MEKRYTNDRGNDCLISVDCVDHEILEPWPYSRHWSRRWYSHKFKGPGLRYEVALSILTGSICWINGPFPCGVANDWQIFKNGLLLQLDEGERVEADDGYAPGDPEFTKTPSGIYHREERNVIRRRVMARQETINKRNKQWGILSQVYRHGIEKHQSVFSAICVLTQITIDNGNPLFDTSEYTDYQEEGGEWI